MARPVPLEAPRFLKRHVHSYGHAVAALGHGKRDVDAKSGKYPHADYRLLMSKAVESVKLLRSQSLTSAILSKLGICKL